MQNLTKKWPNPKPQWFLSQSVLENLPTQLSFVQPWQLWHQLHYFQDPMVLLVVLCVDDLHVSSSLFVLPSIQLVVPHGPFVSRLCGLHSHCLHDPPHDLFPHQTVPARRPFWKLGAETIHSHWAVVSAETFFCMSNVMAFCSNAALLPWIFVTLAKRLCTDSTKKKKTCTFKKASTAPVACPSFYL